MRRVKKVKRPIKVVSAVDARVLAAWTGETVGEATAKRDAFLQALLERPTTPSLVKLDGRVFAIVYQYIAGGDDPTVSWNYDVVGSSGSRSGMTTFEEAHDAAWDHAFNRAFDEEILARAGVGAGAPMSTTAAVRASVEFWASTIPIVLKRLGTTLDKFRWARPEKLSEMASYYAWQVIYARAELAGEKDPHRTTMHADRTSIARDILAGLEVAA